MKNTKLFVFILAPVCMHHLLFIRLQNVHKNPQLMHMVINAKSLYTNNLGKSGFVVLVLGVIVEIKMIQKRVDSNHKIN